MDLQIYGKNVEITDTIDNYIKKKTAKLNRYLTNIEESKAEISREKTKSPDDRFRAQITIRSRGNILRSEERAPSINLAIDATVDSLTRQISRFKSKFDKRSGNLELVTKKPKTEVATEQELKLNDMSHVVKVKHFQVKSMSVNEAIDQMELLNHDFFLFLNDKQRALNLVYRRKNGNYGLIQPEITGD